MYMGRNYDKRQDPITGYLMWTLQAVGIETKQTKSCLDKQPL